MGTSAMGYDIKTDQWESILVLALGINKGAR